LFLSLGWETTNLDPPICNVTLAVANTSDLSESSINKPNLKNRVGLIAPYGAMPAEFNLKSHFVISSPEQT
jgi:hypothetical protein